MEMDSVVWLGSVCVIYVILVRIVGMNVWVMVVVLVVSVNVICVLLECIVIFYV